jgi:HAD superfamily hydrolase (TIGR01509 family)
MKGYIFDFNGTLFWDSAYHEKAWQKIALQIRGNELSAEETRQHLHGRTNPAIIEYLFGHTVDPAEIVSISEQKENIYRHICLSLETGFHLAEGVPELLDILKEKQVPMTIATSSERENLDFYIRHFQLPRWFDLDKIVYHNGSFAGKPAPDIYQIAAKNLGLLPSECTVLEDSFSGIRSAVAAGIGRIVYVNPTHHPLEPELEDQVLLIINDFSEISIGQIVNR